MTGWGRTGLRRALVAIGATVLAVTGTALTTVVTPGQAGAAAPTRDSPGLTVLARPGVPLAEAVAAVEAAGGRVAARNAAIGVLTATATTVTSGDSGFAARLRRAPVIAGVADIVPVGWVPRLVSDVVSGPAEGRGTVGVTRAQPATEPASPGRPSAGPRPAGPSADPLDGQLWGLAAIKAAQARERQPGDRRVRVGVLDTGVDGTHPDLAPNFNRKLSRNFTTDLPTDPRGRELDGPCEVEGCVDGPARDDNGHGTHVAGTIAAAANRLGVSGVAPGVQIINVRGGADSGLFFLQPVVDAITYSADIGVDVLNMSFYVDPWLFNCPAALGDTPEQQEQQRVTIEAMERAMTYAHERGVTQLAAYGNSGRNPDPALRLDTSSPNFPLGGARPRVVQPGAECKSYPRQGPHAITVGAYGPSGAKAGYSNFGSSMSVSAPGGWFGDYAGTEHSGAPQNGILSAYPRELAEIDGTIDEAGELTEAGRAAGVQRDCRSGSCGYYRFTNGTSMATPHAAGVAALIVSQFGKGKGARFGLDPAKVRAALEETAVPQSCPDPLNALATYGDTCSAERDYTTFYGHGSVDALAAVTRGSDAL